MSGTWTRERIKKLEDLWNTNLSTAEIGRRLGVTKNAAVAKAHRMGLPERGSPIRRKQGAAPPPKPQKMGPVRRSLFAEPGDRPTGCRWPLWDDHEAPTHQYCGAPVAVAGEPYCPEHLALAYVPAPRPRRAA